MNLNTAIKLDATEDRSIADIAQELAILFGRRADQSADEDDFVADNIAAFLSGRRPPNCVNPQVLAP